MLWDTCTVSTIIIGKCSYFKRASLNFLDPDHVEWQELVQHRDGVHHHRRKEVLLVSYELRAEGRGSTF